MTAPRTIGEARAIAITWIEQSSLSFEATFIGGSIAYADPAAAYDPASDIDCYLVPAGEPPDGKIGKIRVNGVLLDVSWIARPQLVNAENDAVLASLLRFGLVVRDDGHLGSLQRRIADEFALPENISGRLESMRTKIRAGLATGSSHLAAPEQVMNWLFPATLATHIPLIRACAPLTVRKRFVAAKQVMIPTDYENLLSLYGFANVTREQAQTWLNETALLLDATSEVATSSQRFWATDIQPDARHIAIGGSQLLIDTGMHREALYWIVATSARCLTVLHDADTDTSAFMPAFDEMTTTLGIATSSQRRARTAGILEWIGS